MMTDKRTSGSITVEAAIVLPVFICVVISLAMLIKLVYVHDVVQHAIDEAANELAAYSYIYNVSGIQEIHDTIQDNLNQGAEQAEGHIDTVIGAFNDLEAAVELSDTFAEEVSDSVEFDKSFAEKAENIIWRTQDTFKEGQQLTEQNIENIKALEAAFDDACKDPQKEIKSLAWMLLKGVYSDAKTIIAVPIIKYSFRKYIAQGSYAEANARLEKLNICNGLEGMDFYSSTIFDGDENIDIIVKYKVELPLAIDLLPELYILQRSTARAWLSGGDGTELNRGSIWDLDNWSRGTKIEEMYVGNLPPRFPVIDIYDEKSKTGTSIKSINLNSKTYQSDTELSKKLKGYIDKLKDSATLVYDNKSYELSHKKLILVIPKDSLNDNNQSILNQIKAYAIQNNIEITISEL